MIGFKYHLTKPCEVFINMDDLPLAPSYQYVQLTSYGFRWGFSCDGSYQLAFALLLHFFGAIDAQKYFLQFASEVISELPIKKDRVIFLWEEDLKTYIARKKGIQTALGKRYWNLAERLFFSDDFYIKYVKPARLYEKPEPRTFVYPLSPRRLNAIV